MTSQSPMLQTAVEPARLAREPLVRARRARFSPDVLLHWLVSASSLAILLMLFSLVVVLAQVAVPAMRQFGGSFLATSEWRPNELEVPRRDEAGKIVFADGEMLIDKLPPQFGALPVIYGTAVSSALALLLAVPLSIGTALFLVRIAPRVLVPPVSFLVEFLAAIPSIAYGIWGLFVLVPLLQWWEHRVQSALPDTWAFHWLLYDTQGRPIAPTGRDMLCGGLVLAIMILPIITAISRDVLKAVPRAQIEGTQALGATWWQSCVEMLRYSRSGLFGAVMLGLARAAGETMAVTMVIGNNSQIQPSLFAPAQTMASLLANQFAEAETALHRSALIEVALILLVMSLFFNVTARMLVVGRRMAT